MNTGLQPVLNWWAERKLRERLLVLACSSAVLLMAGDALFTAPAEKRVKQARNVVQTQRSQLEAARLGSASGSNGQLQREQAQRLQQRVQAAQVAVGTMRRQASEAARLPETLRAITATVGSARLLALDLSGDTAQPPPPGASAPGGDAAAATAGAQPAVSAETGARLYRLPITLKVSGTYEELHMLLTQIERHAEALQWSSVTLDNSDWPAIQLTLKAHVLSPDPRWGAAS
jgi:type II secretory pathway pseudopilin PulG